MIEIIVVALALVAVKHFFRVSPRSFSPEEIRELTAVSRSEYRALARRYR